MFTWKPCICGEASPESATTSGSTCPVNHGDLAVGDYFDDAEDPRRLPFDKSFDYSRSIDGTFHDPRVQNLYRNLQIANQLHSCCFTCFKYCLAAKICRFGYPKDLATLKAYLVPDAASPTTTAYAYARTDANNRKRKVVNPPTNNAYLNPHAFSPLLFCAHRANMDCKVMDTYNGTVEYVSNYSSKCEAPDFSKIGNIYVKKIAGLARSGRAISDRQKLNAIGSALIDSEIVGAPQMCFALIGLPLVISSRPVESINALHRDFIHARVKTAEQRKYCSEGDSAISSDGNSHFAKRDAYSALVKFHLERFSNNIDENGEKLGENCCVVTFYSLRSDYTSKKIKCVQLDHSKSDRRKRGLKELDHPLSIDPETGFIQTSEKSFSAGGYEFTRRRKRAVIHLSPHIPINHDDDRSAYSLLLLHHVWPGGEERALTPDGNVMGSQTHFKALYKASNSDVGPGTFKLLKHVNLVLNTISKSEYHQKQNLEDYGANRSMTNFIVQQGASCHNNDSDSDHDDTEDVLDTYVEPSSMPVTEDQENDDDPFEALARDQVARSQLLDMEFATVITHEEHQSAIQFIDKVKLAWADAQSNTFTTTELIGISSSLRHDTLNSQMRIPVNDHVARSEQLKDLIQRLDPEQKLGFDTVTAAVDRDGIGEQLIMFASGEGGTGKSHFIKAVSEYCNLKVGKTRGKYGAVIKFGPTGASAFNIGGCTWQSGLRKAKRLKKGADLNKK